MTATQFVYFHGQPGSPAELRLARPGGWERSPDLLVPDRAQDQPHLQASAYLDHLAASILDRFPLGPLRLVGFSLGAFVAIEVALRLIQMAPGRELSLDLVSPAAPLGCGDFLGDMAGGGVFALARDRPVLFGLMTRIQGWLAAAAPAFLFSQIFRSSAGADAALAAEPEFRCVLKAMLAHALGGAALGYRRDVLAYVAQAPERLSALTAPVALWQGEADNWTPPDMTRALAKALSNVREVRTFPGLSHYSTLRAALPEIFRDLG